ncbi:YdcF family protein [Mesorhizobium sp. Z1-4]|uniref:YdcF family protein n=1 Tax=Mesorhizobium sp. Z1-4 TaxID=2448478 RepID=UPI000FDB351B|nr:YdcF family protein [Mesorhizobium sp. Z1-4]
MFFYLSKIFWFFLQPLGLATLLLFAGLVILAASWRKTAASVFCASFLVLFISSWTTFGALMLRPLEDRFQRPDVLPSAIAGIIVLGGGFEGSVNAARGGYELASAGDRFVEAAVLAHRLPGVPVVVAGGSGALLLHGEPDADTAPRLLTALGVSPERLVLENQSRNTQENAVFTRDLLQPDSTQSWILVTSAFHMPRSMSLFRRAGFNVIAWPVDYRTTGAERIGLAQDNAIDSLHTTTLAIREWVGLFAYRLTGRIDSVFPGP